MSFLADHLHTGKQDTVICDASVVEFSAVATADGSAFVMGVGH